MVKGKDEMRNEMIRIEISRVVIKFKRMNPIAFWHFWSEIRCRRAAAPHEAHVAHVT